LLDNPVRLSLFSQGFAFPEQKVGKKVVPHF